MKKFLQYAKRNTLKLVLLALILGFNSNAFAKTYKLTTGNEFPPFADKHLLNGGIATEIVQHAFKEMGHETIIKWRPWLRGYYETKNGEHFATFPYNKSAEREKYFYFSKPFIISALRFFVKKGSNTNYIKDEDLKGLRLCNPLGYELALVQHLLDKKILKLIQPPALSSCWRMLKMERAHLLLINEFTGWASIKETFGKKGLEEFETLDKALSESDLNLIISKKNPEAKSFLIQFNKKIAEMSQRGTIKAIIDQHLKQ